MRGTTKQYIRSSHALWLIALLSTGANGANANSHFSESTLVAQASCQHLFQSGATIWPVIKASSKPANSENPLGAVTSEPYENVQGQRGTRFVGELIDGGKVLWTTTDDGLRVVNLQISTSIDSKPQMLWQFDEQCQLTQHRKIIYKEQGPENRILASELHVLDTTDGSVVIAEPLNPQVPSHAFFPNPELQRVRVALVDSGVNYTLSEINNRLARDNAGNLIGYDYWDNDALPFDAHFEQSDFHVIRHGTGTASLLLNESAHAELVPYRHPRPDMSRMKALVEHAVANDVRIIGLPISGSEQDEWEAFASAASAHPDLLFIASAGNNGRSIDQHPVYPAALDLPNLLVVTAADDFVKPAGRANWGQDLVDYMIPAEEQNILNFFGQQAKASGPSYAVSRAMALAIRWLVENPDWNAKELIAEFSTVYAQGETPRYVKSGYIADPLSRDATDIELVGVQTLSRDEAVVEEPEQTTVKLPLSVFVLHENWTTEQINQSLLTAESVLRQCNISFNSVTITQLSVPEHLRDLATGPAKTLTNTIQSDSEIKPIAVFYARNNLMLEPTNTMAFSRLNTGGRQWLADSVWLLKDTQEPGIALAQELFHVLANSSGHTYLSNNLMLPKPSSENTALLPAQCEAVIETGKKHSLLFD